MAILISSALLGPSLVGWDAPVHAQQPALSIVSTTSNPGWNLRWRRSPNVQAPPAGASQPAIAAPAQPAIASSRRLASTAVPTATVPVTTNAATSNTLQFRRPAFAAPQATGQIALASDQRPFHANAVAQQGQWVGDSSMVATAEFVQPTHLEAPVNPIRQVQDQQVATGNYRLPANQGGPAAADQQAKSADLFNNPFVRDQGKSPTIAVPVRSAQAESVLQGSAPAAMVGQLPQENIALPSQLPPASETLPTPPQSNQLRQPANPPSIPNSLQLPGDAAPSDAASGFAAPQPPAMPAPTIPAPATDKPAATPPAGGGLREQLTPNPFNQLDPAKRPMPQEETAPENAAPRVEFGQPRLETQPRPLTPKRDQFSCEDFRKRIAEQTLDKISLDPSPPFRPEATDERRFRKAVERFSAGQQVRDWTGIDGEVLGTGRFIDLSYEQVVIETSDGNQQRIALSSLNEGDLGYVTENWGLPKECLLEQVAYNQRQWTPMTMTWNASNICSNTRYFEQVNLERYGHSAGPILQPIASSAHFFGNVFALPYKMGIHPPNECHYPLGYYRPGNCAPWICQPIPLSWRGAATAGAFWGGAIALVP